MHCMKKTPSDRRTFVNRQHPTENFGRHRYIFRIQNLGLLGAGRGEAMRGGAAGGASPERTRTGGFPLVTTDPYALHGIGFLGMPCMKHTETNNQSSARNEERPWFRE